MIRIATLLFALLLAGEAAALPDREEPRVQSERVTISDVDLNSSEGQSVVRHRIEHAAGDVCDIGGMASMEDFEAASQCYRRSVRNALQQINRLAPAGTGR